MRLSFLLGVAVAAPVLACQPTVNRFVVHGDAPGTVGAVVPPSDAAPVVVAAEISLNGNAARTPTIVFKRTAPDVREFPPVPLPQTNNWDSVVLFEAVVATGGYQFPNGESPPLRFTYPSRWEAVLHYPYGSSSQVTSFNAFSVGLGPNCMSLDEGLSGWQISAAYRWIPSLGVDGQPAQPERLASPVAVAFADENWPQSIAGTGSLGFVVPHDLAEASTGESAADQWYVKYHGRVRPGMLDAAGVELYVKGTFNVQVGLTFTIRGVQTVVFAPYGAYVEQGEWRRVTARFPEAPPGATRAGDYITVRMQGGIAGLRANQRILFDHVCSYSSN